VDVVADTFLLQSMDELGNPIVTSADDKVMMDPVEGVKKGRKDDQN